MTVEYLRDCIEEIRAAWICHIIVCYVESN
jgi:hypothetical protein